MKRGLIFPGLCLILVGCSTPHVLLGPPPMGASLVSSLGALEGEDRRNVALEPVSGTEKAWVSDETTERQLPQGFALPWKLIEPLVGNAQNPSEVRVTIGDFDLDGDVEILYHAWRTGGPPPLPELPPEQGFEVIALVDVAVDTYHPHLIHRDELDDGPAQRNATRLRWVGSGDIDHDGATEVVLERIRRIDELAADRHELLIIEDDGTSSIRDLGERHTDEVGVREVVDVGNGAAWAVVLQYFEGESDGLLETGLEVWVSTADGSLEIAPDAAFALLERTGDLDHANRRAAELRSSLETNVFVVSDLAKTHFAVAIGPVLGDDIQNWSSVIRDKLSSAAVVDGHHIGDWVRP